MQLKTFKVLIVEDDDDHADLLLFNLARTGVPHESDRAINGRQALDYLFQRGDYQEVDPPDLVLLDLKMPGFSGLDVLEAIKSDPDHKRIPVLMLTTSDAPDDRSAAYRLHANGYLVKPMDFAEYRSMANDLLSFWTRWNRGAELPGERRGTQLPPGEIQG